MIWDSHMSVLSHLSCVWLFTILWTIAPRFYCLWNSPGKNIGVGCHFLLQGIFPTQGLNSCLPHCSRILCCWATREAPSWDFHDLQICKYINTYMSSWLSPQFIHKLHHPIYQNLHLMPCWPSSSLDELSTLFSVANPFTYTKRWPPLAYSKSLFWQFSPSFSASPCSPLPPELFLWAYKKSVALHLKKTPGVVLRWQRNRMGRPISPPQIHRKNIWTLSKFYKTTSECWQRTSGTQKGSPLSSKGDGEVLRLL